MHILHVEDSNFDARAVRRALTAIVPQVSILHMTTVDAALEYLKLEASTDFDAVLSDLNLPGKSGYDLARSIREQNLAPGAALIMISSDQSDRARQEAASAGFDGSLGKPVSRAGLKACLVENMLLCEPAEQKVSQEL